MIRIIRKLNPSVKNLNATHDWLDKKLAPLPVEQRTSIHMACMELLENGLKYHKSHNIRALISLKITITREIIISVTNRIKCISDTETLINSISEINRSNDPETQYMNRLKKIMEHRIHNESRLGLLRIAGEGNFRIDYNLMEKEITVSARKQVKRMNNSPMKSLIREDFSIIVKEGSSWQVIWTGRSRDLNPSLILDPYLEKLQNHLLENEVVIDFSKMEAMNSSTIPPILTFISNLEKKRIRTVVQYSNTIYWQRASFRPLSVLTRDFVFVTITAV